MERRKERSRKRQKGVDRGEGGRGGGRKGKGRKKMGQRRREEERRRKKSRRKKKEEEQEENTGLTPLSQQRNFLLELKLIQFGVLGSNCAVLCHF